MKVLVCGSRSKKDYSAIVYTKLSLSHKPEVIIHGDCKEKGSADEYADTWARSNNVPVDPNPSHPGDYLPRNLRMLDKLSPGKDMVLAFYDGWSYGTAHVIANALMRRIYVEVVGI